MTDHRTKKYREFMHSYKGTEVEGSPEAKSGFIAGYGAALAALKGTK